jgi:hypothetical protein
VKYIWNRKLQRKMKHILCPIYFSVSFAFFKILNKRGEISGSDGGKYEDDCLLGCCAL